MLVANWVWNLKRCMHLIAEQSGRPGGKTGRTGPERTSNTAQKLNGLFFFFLWGGRKRWIIIYCRDKLIILSYLARVL